MTSWTLADAVDASQDHNVLPGSPLVHVVGQVRFPALTALAQGSPRWGEVAARLEDDYPLQQGADLLGVGPAANMRRFKDAAGEWFVSISDQFVALSTTAYTRRQDFLERFGAVWGSLLDVAKVPTVDRAGFRYINQEQGEERVADVAAIIRPEILGLMAQPEMEGALLRQGLTQAQFDLADSGSLIVHAGILPAGAVLDETLPASQDRSWILDIDAFFERSSEASVEAVVATLGESAQRAYGFFRRAITDAALARFERGSA